MHAYCVKVRSRFQKPSCEARIPMAILSRERTVNINMCWGLLATAVCTRVGDQCSGVRFKYDVINMTWGGAGAKILKNVFLFTTQQNIF